MLHSLFGRSKGRRLYFTGAKITAKELDRLGLVEACVPRDLAGNRLGFLHDALARQSPRVLRVAKQVYNAVDVASYREGKAVEQAMTPQLVASEDFKEARRAAAEGRKPRYTGR